MHVAVNSEKMREIEYQTIEKIGISAMVLMERAAMEIVKRVQFHIKNKQERILCVCGIGNNGGDGVAAARILRCQGYAADILLIGQEERATAQLKEQLKIARNLQVNVLKVYPKQMYTYIIDALFGISFHGKAEGEYEEAIKNINNRNEGNYKVISVDIPSGVCADTGAVKGSAVIADETIAFGEIKIGTLLYPGTEYAGEVIRADIGFSNEVIMSLCHGNTFEYFLPEDIEALLPVRKAYSNKGSYGTVLIVAGSNEMAGAAYLSAAAAYHMGVGLVKVLTSREGVRLIQHLLPEAVTLCYECDDIEGKVQEALSGTRVVVMGPGIGKGKIAEKLFKLIMKHCKVSLVLDADALNILSVNIQGNLNLLSDYLPAGTVLTPHLKELSRLMNRRVTDITGNLIDIAKQCTYNNEMVYVIKDARTIVASGESRYINLSGNDGMATGGSGDVLTGIIAGLLSGGLPPVPAARLGVYLHGRAGDLAAVHCGKYAMLARDIIHALASVLSEQSIL